MCRDVTQGTSNDALVEVIWSIDSVAQGTSVKVLVFILGCKHYQNWAHAWLHIAQALIIPVKPRGASTLNPKP